MGQQSSTCRTASAGREEVSPGQQSPGVGGAGLEALSPTSRGAEEGKCGRMVPGRWDGCDGEEAAEGFC